MAPVTASGLAEVVRDFENVSTKSDAFRRSMRIAGSIVRQQVREEIDSGAVVQSRSKRLRRSIRFRVLETLRGPEGEVIPGAFYAGVIEEGRTIHAKTPAGMKFPGAYAGAQLIAAGIYRRSRTQMVAAAKRGGVLPTSSYTRNRSVGGKLVNRKGDLYYGAKQLKPYRMGVSREFGSMLRSGSSYVGIGWHTVQSVTIKPHPFLERSAEASSEAVANVLGGGYSAQLTRAVSGR